MELSSCRSNLLLADLEIASLARPTDSVPFIAFDFDAVATRAHPADDARGIADHEREIRHVPCDNGAGADSNIRPDHNVLPNSAIISQAAISQYMRKMPNGCSITDLDILIKHC